MNENLVHAIGLHYNKVANAVQIKSSKENGSEQQL